MGRNLYLKNTPADEARAMFMSEVERRCRPETEIISSVDALGRVTAEAIYAKCSSPHYNAAAMDGIAVRAEITGGASEVSPVILSPEDYIQVNTGNAIIDPYNAVIMAENAFEKENGDMEIFSAAAPWQHIRPIGEDIVAGEMIMTRSHVIRAIDIGVLLEAGITHISVVKKPLTAIFPTGSEIVELEEVSELVEGQIIESNSRMFENMVRDEGGNAKRYGILKDDHDLIRSSLLAAAKEHDLVIINAGTSAGTKDFTVKVLREIGEVLVHGVAVKPGKPCILAFIGNTPVIGLPGYPVSAYIGFTNFVTPVLEFLGRRKTHEYETVRAVVSRRLVSGLKYEEYVRVKAGIVDGKVVAAPLARGAGAAMSLVRADGFCIIPANLEGLEAGEETELKLYRPLSEIANTVVITGSHDLIIDVISDIMANRHPNLYVSSTHVGSTAGLMALKRGEAHITPTHLLNEADGVYNIAYLKRLFKEPMVLVKGVERIQGLMVPEGNPLDIKGVEDLKRDSGIRYINRQRGAGTRVLFDYRLKQLGISPDEIDGYDREGATHMAVAAAVKNGSADTGMGVLSAANSMGLEFIEVGVEEYDFAIPERFLELPAVRAFLEVLESEELHQKLDDMGGYGYSRAGQIIRLSE